MKVSLLRILLKGKNVLDFKWLSWQWLKYNILEHNTNPIIREITISVTDEVEKGKSPIPWNYFSS